MLEEALIVWFCPVFCKAERILAGEAETDWSFLADDGLGLVTPLAADTRRESFLRGERLPEVVRRRPLPPDEEDKVRRRLGDGEDTRRLGDGEDTDKGDAVAVDMVKGGGAFAPAREEKDPFVGDTGEEEAVVDGRGKWWFRGS